MSDTEIPMDDERVAQRSVLSDEERRAGTDDATTQARAILEESDERGAAAAGHRDRGAEHRRSEDTVEPT